VHALFWDLETRSTVSLKAAGAWRYAGDPVTEVLCVSFAIDENDPEIWIPGQQIPAAFAEAAQDERWLIVAHNDMFERAIETRLLHPRYGWPTIPLERRRCSMAMALASALPGALEKAAEVSGLPHQKDSAGHKVMRLMSRPRRPRKDEAPGVYWHDSPELRERLYLYCKQDVAAERALFHHLPLLSLAEQELWQLDAKINDRGFSVDQALANAARGIALAEQAAIDAELSDLTRGEITSVNQVAKIVALVRRNGHEMTSLTKRSVSAVLAHDPGEVVCRILELRREGARASVRKLDSLLAGIDSDDRLRGTLRYHGSSTGRWSGSRFQPQNLKKPETSDMNAAVDAVFAGDMQRVRELGPPLTIVGDISRSIVRAASGHSLISGDFSAIESRLLAWLAGESAKLETYRRFDASGDPALEPYCATASLILKRPVTPADEPGRTIGKTCDLAFGFGGGLGAWRKFDSSDRYSDADVERFKGEWRNAHRATVRFWHGLENAIHRAIITGQPVTIGKLVCGMVGSTLQLGLPSGRKLAYPEARLGPGKFEGARQVTYKDNARGGWRDCDAWYGTFVENVVQATARDLLAASMLRLEAAGYPIAFHVHDEIVSEVPESDGSEDDFHALMLTLPPWAESLPLAAKVRIGERYAKGESADSIQSPAGRAFGDHSTAWEGRQHVKTSTPLPEVPPEIEDPAPSIIPLADLIGRELVDGKTACPFHDDSTPSCHVYNDHYHCFGCGAHGDAIDWLMMVEGLSRKEALTRLETWDKPPVVLPQRSGNGDNQACALRLWEQARPIAGTLAARYLAEIRGIDLEALPADSDRALRFHPRCPFGSGTQHPCLVALMRNVTTDEPTGIHRTALALDAGKIDRRTLGRWGAVKLWPAAGSQLVVGEGLETVLAAATRIPYRGEPLRPAWSALSTGPLRTFPVVAGVERLIILVDHDQAGVTAAAACADRWQRAGRAVVKLKPTRAGTDFNDLILPKVVP
jgi:DNA polymerase